MRRRPLAIVLALMLPAAAAIADGCSAAGEKPPTTTGAGGGAHAGSSASVTGSGGADAGATSSTSAASTTGGHGGAGGAGGGPNLLPDAGDAGDAADAGDSEAGTCGSQCGPVELCDTAHLGLDDNCNGSVDEGCPCHPGQLHWCFEGDPKYHGTPGCFDGTEACTELGIWGPCMGGVHAVAPDFCYQNNTSNCHAITTLPFAPVHLQTGTGSFSGNAVPGSETYTVACPSGVSQCPAVMTPDLFQPLQSGEYTVTYTKSVSGNPAPLSCTYPLFVSAPGLRVELSWEHYTTDHGVDLDLHLHEPVSTLPWAISPGSPQDCGWKNCALPSFEPPQDPTSPTWFSPFNMVPQPVDWDVQPVAASNTCYNIPRGIGALWQALGMGCHNPRLDIDDFQCDFTVTDPNDPMFCAPENINVDYVPANQWFRIGVHYFYNHMLTYDVHPEVKVFYNGGQFADLGPQGYFMPTAPVTFPAADGAGNGTGFGNVFWLVADVAVVDDGCGTPTAVVQPLYADPTTLAPLLSTDTQVQAAFDPPWPPPPM